MSNNKNGFPHLHNHTEYSLCDGVQSIKSTFDKAKELGATALAITDHGLCAGWVDAFLYGNEIGVKPILGVEAYINTSGYYANVPLLKDKEIRQHLVLLARDYKGLQAISRFVSETNRNIDDRGKPCGTLEMLQKFFGKGSEGNKHVICLSACIGGPLAQAFLYNHRIEHEIDKISKRNEGIYLSFSEEYFEAQKKVTEVNATLEVLNAEIEQITAKTKTSFKEIKSVIKAEKDEEKKKFLEEQLEAEKLEVASAKELLKKKKEEKKSLSASISADKKIISKFRDKRVRISDNEEKIKQLKGALLSMDELFDRAKSVLEDYVSVFGTNFYAEVQYHGIQEEAFAYPLIAELARENFVSIVATNDCHVTSKEDLRTRTLMRNAGQIKRKIWTPDQTGDEHLYMKNEDEMIDILSRILPEDVVEEAIHNAYVIAKDCELPAEKDSKDNLRFDGCINKYPQFDNANQRLRELAESNIEERYGDNWNEEYQARLDYELGIIEQMDFPSYFLFIQDVIAEEKSFGNINIGPGRGSGGGSIVCYLTHITEIDPMKNNLLFERFLNPERVSMPKQILGV